jgi:hypothetical protein
MAGGGKGAKIAKIATFLRVTPRQPTVTRPGTLTPVRLATRFPPPIQFPMPRTPVSPPVPRDPFPHP